VGTDEAVPGVRAMTAPADPFDYGDDETVADDDSEAAYWRNQREDAGTDRHNEGTYADLVAAVRRVAFTVACRACRMPIDTPCVRIGTSEPLRKLPCHPVRESDARKSTR
jgi:hypothetical protein